MAGLWKRGIASVVLVSGLLMSLGLSRSEILTATSGRPVWNFAGARAGGQATGTLSLVGVKSLNAGDKVIIHLPYVSLAAVVGSDVFVGGSGCTSIATAYSGGLGSSATCILKSEVSAGNVTVQVAGLTLPKFVVLGHSADVVAAGTRLDAYESVLPQSDPATSVRVAVYPTSSGASGAYAANLIAQLVDASGNATDNGGNAVSLGFSSSDSSAVFSSYDGVTGPNGAPDYTTCSGPGTAGSAPSDAVLGEVLCHISATSAKVPVVVDAAGYSFEKPQPMAGLGSAQAASIGAAAYDSYLVTKSGALLSVGENPLGELGNASTVAYATSPVSAILPAGVSVSSVAGGGYFALALTSTGSVLTWGQNDQGQLGQGTSSLDVASPSPTLIPAGVKVTQIAAGCNSAYALTSTGQVYAWGSDSVGELGNGSHSGSVSSPVLVEMPVGVQPVQLSAGNSDGYVLTSTHEIYAWGSNALGQLGDGSRTNASIPTKVTMPNVNVVSVVGGGFNAFAITGTHQLYVWGGNYDGQDGVGSTVDQYRPVKVTMPGSVGVEQVNGASAGGFASMALGSNGVVYTWGANFDAQLGIGILTTGYHSLALSGNGQLYAWGDNRTQGFGVASPVESEVPLKVGLSETFSQLASGCDHSLALTSTGQVYAWGANQDGQLGIGSVGTVASPSPVDVPGTVTAVVAGCLSSYALTSTGQVYAWGANQDGQLGIGSTDATPVPTLVSSLPAGVTQVVAGEYSAYALTSTGQVYAWGANQDGQLGIGSTVPQGSPALVSLGNAVVPTELAAGYSDAYALTSTGQVYAWGANQDGQLGTGTRAPSASPVLVGLPSKVQRVWSGYNQGFGEVNGTLYAWGSNTTGQLGTGGFFNVLTPLPVVLPAGQSVTNVSSPGVSTLFSLANGEVYGVGGNLFGQLGDNSLLTVAIPAMVHSGGVNLHDAVMGGYPNYAQLYPTSISAMLRSVSLTKLVVG